MHAIAVDQLNAYDVLVNDEVVFTSAALAAYVAGPTTGRSAKAVATESEAGLLVEPVEDTESEPTNAELAAASVEESVEPTQRGPGGHGRVGRVVRLAGPAPGGARAR